MGYRYITRADLDGLSCAVLLKQVESIDQMIYVGPKNMQDGKVEVTSNDIIANLPYHPNCHLWFDHHASNRINHPFKGNFFIAPSAARVVYEHSGYNREKFSPFMELLLETDRIDSAQITPEDITRPEGFFLLSCTLEARPGEPEEDNYRNQVVELLCNNSISEVLSDPQVKFKTERFLEEQEKFKSQLLKFSHLDENAIITDTREGGGRGDGNRFLIYTLFPKGDISLSIYRKREENLCVVSIGKSVFNRVSAVHVGNICAHVGGGGHQGAGTCRFPIEREEEWLPQIIRWCKGLDPLPTG